MQPAPAPAGRTTTSLQASSSFRCRNEFQLDFFITALADDHGNSTIFETILRVRIEREYVIRALFNLLEGVCHVSSGRNSGQTYVPGFAGRTRDVSVCSTAQ